MFSALIYRCRGFFLRASHLTENGHENVKLFTGDLDRIPLASDSVDVVLTIHAVEPNQGREEAILSELLRVARKHLVMIEPSYELASAEARERMDRLGYVRGTTGSLKTSRPSSASD